MNTKYGEMDETLLEKRVIEVENDTSLTIRTEYWFEGEEVRSDLDIKLKKGIDVSSFIGQLGDVRHE